MKHLKLYEEFLDSFDGEDLSTRLDELSNVTLLSATDIAHGFAASQNGKHAPSRAEKGARIFSHIFRDFIGKTLAMGTIEKIEVIGRSDDGFRITLSIGKSTIEYSTYYDFLDYHKEVGNDKQEFYLRADKQLEHHNHKIKVLPIQRKDANLLWKIVKTYNPKTTIVPSSFKLYGDHISEK